MEEAALANDKQLAKFALIAYCLHKMSSKQHVVMHGRWPDIKHDILFDLEKAVKAIERGDLKAAGEKLDAVIGSVKAADESIGNYVQNLFEKAKVKYASKAYSMGLGLGQAAALTGAEKKALLRYIGVTKIADRQAVGPGIGERLKRLKKSMVVEK